MDVCIPGSSPHARGTQLRIHCVSAACRFIPAYAGNAARRARTERGRTVHPRIRGERIQRTSSGFTSIGSSPHTRGTLDHHGITDRCARFIPAYAGNAGGGGGYSGVLQVHPRIRGERFRARWKNSSCCGSSPHTRGTLDLGTVRNFRNRFIPAYAGNTPRAGTQTSLPTVHPRIRGERSTGAVGDVEHVGSSPHTRGTRSCAAG